MKYGGQNCRSRRKIFDVEVHRVKENFSEVEDEVHEIKKNFSKVEDKINKEENIKKMIDERFAKKIKEKIDKRLEKEVQNASFIDEYKGS